MTETEPRHCGRCQREFDGDPWLYFQTDWALCPTCREILLPRPAARQPLPGLDDAGRDLRRG